jgi:hypothetical protein
MIAAKTLGDHAYIVAPEHHRVDEPQPHVLPRHHLLMPRCPVISSASARSSTALFTGTASHRAPSSSTPVGRDLAQQLIRQLLIDSAVAGPLVHHRVCGTIGVSDSTCPKELRAALPAAHRQATSPTQPVSHASRRGKDA